MPPHRVSLQDLDAARRGAAANRLRPLATIPLDCRDVVVSACVLEAPHDEHAEAVLLAAVRIVAPIMRIRGWAVPIVEFYPKNNSLYGMNANKAKIYLRLRTPGDREAMLDDETVLDVLLHELAHMVHGNHSAEFYDLHKVLRDEAAGIRIRRMNGIPDLPEGHFWGRGSALGKKTLSSTTTMRQRSAGTSSLSRAAREEFLNRLSSTTTTTTSSQSTLRRLPPSEAARLATIERLKLIDDTSCGNNSQNDNDVLVILDDDDEEEETLENKPRDRRQTEDNRVAFVPKERVPFSSSSATSTGSVVSSSLSQVGQQQTSSSPFHTITGQWECEVCSLLNAEMHLQCAACGNLKPGLSWESNGENEVSSKKVRASPPASSRGESAVIDLLDDDDDEVETKTSQEKQ